VALFCFGTASGFGWMLAYYQIPRALLANVSSWGMGITEVGFFIAFVFLVLGCFLDAIPPIIIVGTTLEPLARSDSGTGGQSQLAAPQTVRTHHFAGRKALYAVSGSSFEIEGMSPEDGRHLFDELKAHALRDKYRFNYFYEVGDVVLWDDLATLHSATLTDPADPRTLWRITIKEPA